MPKGIVKCGNCPAWDLFKNGDPNLVYSISVGQKASTIANPDSGSYYMLDLQNDNAPGSIGMVESVWLGANGVWQCGWETQPTNVFAFGHVFIYKYGKLMNAEGAGNASMGNEWYQITIDEDTGRSWMVSDNAG